MNPKYIIYELDLGGFVLIDNDGDSGYYETLEALMDMIQKCQQEKA